MEGSFITQVREEIAQIARPLNERLLSLDREVQEREAELNELKKARTQLRNAIKSIDPSLFPEEKKAPKKKGRSQSKHLAALQEFLLAHLEEVNGNGGFYASGLLSRYPTELPVPYTSLNRILTTLHEQGVIRLVSTGTGGAKFYKLVDA